MKDSSLIRTVFQLENETMKTNYLVNKTAEDLEKLAEDTKTFTVIAMACIIFFMQGGFAFLESGSVRTKNVTNILMKNLLDSFIAGAAFWGIGYPLAFGKPGNAFCGYGYFFSINMPQTSYHLWFYQFVFAATAATIVSGAMAERCEFFAYFVYSFFITGLIYPIVTHWAWDKSGWLKVGDGQGHHFNDQAGSCVVHLTGGTASIVGAYILGPRMGRFDVITGEPRNLPGHSVPFAALGAFILLFGFFAYAPLKIIVYSRDGTGVSTAIMNVVIASSFAGLGTVFLNWLVAKSKSGSSYWSLMVTINAAITGIVSVLAGVSILPQWASALIGLFGGWIYIGCSELVVKMKIDDPLDVIAVHFGGGLWGTIIAPVFVKGGIIYTASRSAFMNWGWNICGAIAIIIWTGVLCSIMFSILKCLDLLRVDPVAEAKGLDLYKHGGKAYECPGDDNFQLFDRKRVRMSVSLHVKKFSNRMSCTTNSSAFSDNEDTDIDRESEDCVSVGEVRHGKISRISLSGGNLIPVIYEDISDTDDENRKEEIEMMELEVTDENTKMMSRCNGNVIAVTDN